MPPRILSSRDYFSDRTFGDTAVQAMQIKGMRGRIEEDEARRGAYAKVYGGDPSAGYEAEARQGKRKRELAALGQAFGLVDNVYKSYGLEGAQEMSNQIWTTTPEFQKAYPSGPPKIEKGKGKELFWTLETQKERELPDGTIIPAGTMAKFRVVDGKPVEVMGVVKSAKEDAPGKLSTKQSKAVDKYTAALKELYVLDSNILAFKGDKAGYEESLKLKIKHYEKDLPEGFAEKIRAELEQGAPIKKPFPSHSQLMKQVAPAPAQTPEQGVRYGVDNATGRKVMMLPDGTIEYAP